MRSYLLERTLDASGNLSTREKPISIDDWMNGIGNHYWDRVLEGETLDDLWIAKLTFFPTVLSLGFSGNVWIGSVRRKYSKYHPNQRSFAPILENRFLVVFQSADQHAGILKSTHYGTNFVELGLLCKNEKVCKSATEDLCS